LIPEAQAIAHGVCLCAITVLLTPNSVRTHLKTMRQTLPTSTLRSTSIGMLLAIAALFFTLTTSFKTSTSDNVDIESVIEEETCSGSITGIYIYDTYTGARVPGIPALTNNTQIDIASLPGSYYLTVEVNGNIESVQIKLNGQSQSCENIVPYTWPNTSNGSSWNGSVGTYTFEASAYHYDGCSGNQCDHKSFTFSLVEQNCNDFSVELGDDLSICAGETISLSAQVNGATGCECCQRTVSNTNHCNSHENYVLFLKDNDSGTYKFFTGNNDMTWEECGGGTASLNGTVYGDGQSYSINANFSGFSATPPSGSPKHNECGPTNSNGWFYYTSFSGTITNLSSGQSFQFSRRGPAFQVGNGANTTAQGYGGSGWFNVTSSSYWDIGDFNVMLGQSCSSSNGCAPQNIAGTNYLGSYGNSAYYIRPNGDLDYNDALNFAQTRGGTLPTINSQGENDYLASLINGNVWLSLNDIGTEGQYRWADGSPISYASWANGQPNNYNNEDGVELYPNGTWNDISLHDYNWVVVEIPCSGSDLSG